ncbi:hypothetical protein ACX8XN_04150 [Calditrichota bacterium GD2]
MIGKPDQKEVSVTNQGSAAAVTMILKTFLEEGINRNARKVIFWQITPNIAENYLTFKTQAKQTGALLFGRSLPLRAIIFNSSTA